MIINVKVIPNSKKQEIKKEDDVLKIKLMSPAVKGKANKELIELLAKYYNTKKSFIKIKKGNSSKEKVIEVNTSYNI